MDVVELVKFAFFVGTALSFTFIIGLVVGMIVMWVVRPR